MLPPQNYASPVRYRPPAGWYRRLNRVVGVPLTSLGLAPRDAVTLEVRGRRSGRVRRTPVLVTEHEGARYLVALAGESQWVRNVRAASGQALLRRRTATRVRLEEVPVPARAAVLAAYLRAARRRSGEEVADQAARDYFGVENPTVDQLDGVARRYPVFRVRRPRLPDEGNGHCQPAAGVRGSARAGVVADELRESRHVLAWPLELLLLAAGLPSALYLGTRLRRRVPEVSS